MVPGVFYFSTFLLKLFTDTFIDLVPLTISTILLNLCLPIQESHEGSCFITVCCENNIAARANLQSNSDSLRVLLVSYVHFSSKLNVLITTVTTHELVTVRSKKYPLFYAYEFKRVPRFLTLILSCSQSIIKFHQNC